MEPDKFDLRSHDMAEDKRQELLRLFPEARTEGGKIDFERLKLALGESVDVGKERYGMTWPGKAECFKAIQMPSLGTLRPCPEESVNFDTTENLIIEGDNLEVLKLLQKSYLGKVKMIYIDLPYNTGNDFIYPDNYSESLQTYLEYTGQVDAEGKKFSTNAETDGRFHSKWLNMMYPRLYLARNLLRNDGAILISIDDTEVDNLRRISSEVFGEENFLATFVRRRRMATGMRDTPISPDHEYVIAFAKRLDSTRLYGFARSEGDFSLHDAKGRFRSTDLTVGMTREMRPNQYYAIKNPTTGAEFWPPEERVWRFEPATMEKHIAADNIIWPDAVNGGRMTRPRFKTRFDPEDGKTNPVSTWINLKSQNETEDDIEITCLDVGMNQEATKELRELFGEQVLDYPKPTSMIKSLLAVTTRNDDVVLDFFAGSGTTAHAVLELNTQDSGNPKFILVQLPEPTEHKDYPTIADICKERVRRVIKKQNDEGEQASQNRRSRESGNPDLFVTDTLDSRVRENDGGSNQPPNHGFKVFKLAESNFTPWDAEESKDAESLAKQLELHIHHVRDGRTGQDLLFELLLKSGFPLTTPVEKLTLPPHPSPLPPGERDTSKTVYSVANGAMLICLERELTLDLIRAMADKKPERVVCLDEGFAGNDQLKANAVQIFKTKGVTSFKTV